MQNDLKNSKLAKESGYVAPKTIILAMFVVRPIMGSTPTLEEGETISWDDED